MASDKRKPGRPSSAVQLKNDDVPFDIAAIKNQAKSIRGPHARTFHEGKPGFPYGWFGNEVCCGDPLDWPKPLPAWWWTHLVGVRPSRKVMARARIGNVPVRPGKHPPRAGARMEFPRHPADPDGNAEPSILITTPALLNVERHIKKVVTAITATRAALAELGEPVLKPVVLAKGSREWYRQQQNVVGKALFAPVSYPEAADARSARILSLRFQLAEDTETLSSLQARWDLLEADHQEALAASQGPRRCASCATGISGQHARACLFALGQVGKRTEGHIVGTVMDRCQHRAGTCVLCGKARIQL